MTEDPRDTDTTTDTAAEPIASRAATTAPGVHNFVPTGGTIPNHWPGGAGSVYECTKCGARYVLWPGGRVVPVGPWPMQCP